MFQEAKNMFIKALDAYVQKCQELMSEIGKEIAKPGNSSDLDSKKSGGNEEKLENKELEQMMNNFTTLLKGFAFQFQSSSSKAL